MSHIRDIFRPASRATAARVAPAPAPAPVPIPVAPEPAPAAHEPPAVAPAPAEQLGAVEDEAEETTGLSPPLTALQFQLEFGESPLCIPPYREPRAFDDDDKENETRQSLIPRGACL